MADGRGPPRGSTLKCCKPCSVISLIRVVHIRHVLAGRSMVGTMQVSVKIPYSSGHELYTYAMCWQAGLWWAPCRCLLKYLIVVDTSCTHTPCAGRQVHGGHHAGVC